MKPIKWHFVLLGLIVTPRQTWPALVGFLRSLRDQRRERKATGITSAQQQRLMECISAIERHSGFQAWQRIKWHVNAICEADGRGRHDRAALIAYAAELTEPARGMPFELVMLSLSRYANQMQRARQAQSPKVAQP